MLSARLLPSGCQASLPRAVRPLGIVVRGPAQRLLVRATFEDGTDADAHLNPPGSLPSAQAVRGQWSHWSGWPALVYLAAQQQSRVRAQQPDIDASREHCSTPALQAAGGQPAKRQVRALSQTDWEWLEEFAERAEECLLLAELMEEDMHPALGLQPHMPQVRRLVELGAEGRQLAEEIRAALAQTADQCPAALWDRTYELAAQVDQEAGIHKEAHLYEGTGKELIHCIEECLQLAENLHSQNPSRTGTAELCRLRTLTAEFTQLAEALSFPKQPRDRFMPAKLVKFFRVGGEFLRSFEDVQRQCAASGAASGSPASSTMPLPPHPSDSWPPASQALEPGSADARALAAEASAAAAMAWVSAAIGHEAAAEAAEKRAAAQPAAQQAGAAAEWVQAARAWRAAFDALEEAAQAQPEAKVVKDAAAMVRMARSFKHQRHGLQG